MKTIGFLAVLGFIFAGLNAQVNMNSKKLVWQSDLLNTTEVLGVEFGNEIRAEGHILGAPEGQPLDVSYVVLLNSDWSVKSVSIQGQSGSDQNFFMRREGDRWIDRSGKHLEALDGAGEIDISLTPFTNTLPIKRLTIPVGAARENAVVYFDLQERKFSKARQRYTNLGAGFYKYENLESGFVSTIKTDSDGFVVDYPGIWKMVYPTESRSTAGAAFASALVSDSYSNELKNTDRLYDWLIGRWDVRSVDYLADGSRLEANGEWLFSFALEGRAVQDVWIDPKRSERSPATSKTANRYGTSIRFYDRDLKKWRVVWINPVNGDINELTGSKVGKDIVQTGIAKNGNLIRWVFTDIKSGSFRWYGEYSEDGGKTWRLAAEFFGVKAF